MTSSRSQSQITHYLRFKVSKKTGGERIISAPKPNLKTAQRWILENILEKLEVHHAAHGFCKNRSIVTNAKPHVGANIIVNLDLQNFFQSISDKRVKKLFCEFGYSELTATIFGFICTTAEQINYIASENRHLPLPLSSLEKVTAILIQLWRGFCPHRNCKNLHWQSK